MRFNDNYSVKGHALLSPSQYHWTNYDDEGVIKKLNTSMAAAKGTELHALAESCIKNRIKLQPIKKAINQFVNDAIGFGMEPEVVLFYSQHCFGTADAISFTEAPDERPLLRIHDLKTGTTPVKMTQLEVYAALFCLEYQVKPSDIDMLLRIYQGRDVTEFVPSPVAIDDIMFKIVHFTKVLDNYISENIS